MVDRPESRSAAIDPPLVALPLSCPVYTAGAARALYLLDPGEEVPAPSAYRGELYRLALASALAAFCHSQRTPCQSTHTPTHATPPHLPHVRSGRKTNARTNLKFDRATCLQSRGTKLAQATRLAVLTPACLHTLGRQTSKGGHVAPCAELKGQGIAALRLRRLCTSAPPTLTGLPDSSLTCAESLAVLSPWMGGWVRVEHWFCSCWPRAWRCEMAPALPPLQHPDPANPLLAYPQTR